MGLIGAVLAVLPFIPGVRSVPRLIPVHRLIWRDGQETPPPGAGQAHNTLVNLKSPPSDIA